MEGSAEGSQKHIGSKLGPGWPGWCNPKRACIKAWPEENLQRLLGECLTDLGRYPGR